MNNNHFDLSIDMIRSKLIFKGYLLNQHKIDSIISPDLPEEEYALKLREYLDYVVNVEDKALQKYFKALKSIYKPLTEIRDNYKLDEFEFFKLMNEEFGCNESFSNIANVYVKTKNLNSSYFKTLVYFHRSKNKKYHKVIKQLSNILKEEDNRSYIELLYAF